MLESDGSWLLGLAYLCYSLHISICETFCTLIFSHFSVSEIKTHLNNCWHVTVQLAVSFSFSVVHKTIIHLTIDGFLGAMKYSNFC